MKKIYSLFAIACILHLSIYLLNAQNVAQIKTKKYFSFSERIKPGDYQEKTVVLKLKPQFSNINALTAFHEYLSQIGLEQPLRRKFPNAEKPAREYNDFGLKYADLTRIYQFTYKAELPLENVINAIYSMGIVEYAEPNYIMKYFYTPNDPNLSSQWHITKIKCQQAWDLSKGDTNVVVGIVDSEIQWDHPDLSPNIKYNYADPIDGIDNDNDGFIDNFRGWDVGENDNNTKLTGGTSHGTHVAGCAAAATDNGIGVASPAFKCKFLPVKIANSSGSLIAGYEGIEYAADHGATIINCSWGSPGGGQAGQDVIDYATINKGALVVAAAGNDGNETEFFPAAYNYVLAVAASTSTDAKASFSNYGTWIDVASPGSGIYATWPTNTYISSDGTSMASPVAAGAAALVKSYYPFLNALQVGEQLKVTCDPMPSSSQYNAGKLGKGRINLQNALGGINSPSVVMVQKTITDNNDEAFISGDTLEIRGSFINYLLPTGNVTATLFAINNTPNYVTIIDGTTSLGSIAMLGTANNNNDPFKVLIKQAIPVNSKADFRINLSDGSYSTNVYISFTINVDYINIAINEVATSITSKSLIGFNDFASQLEGLGFRFIPSGVAENLLFDGGLMVGVPGKVSDNVRKTGGGTDTDFGSQVRVTKIVPPVSSEFDVKGIFNDNPASAAKLPVEVSHKAYAWTTPGHRRYVIVEYSIKNTGTAPLNSLYAGIYTDWDINMQSSTGYNNNKASTDTVRKLGYTYNLQSGGFYAGVQLLTTSNAGFNHYAMDHINTTPPSVNPNATYGTPEKYTTLSTSRFNAGAPNDVSSVVSGGPFNIAVGDSAIIAFAVLAGENLADLQKSADSACAQYPFNLLASVTPPTCGNNNGAATVSVVGCGTSYSYLWSDGQTSATATGLAAGNYTVTVTNLTGRTATTVISVSNSNAPSIVIASVNDSCGNGGSATVNATGGTSPYSYLWSNGATTQSISNLPAGNYFVSVTDVNNCMATGSATITSTGNDMIVSASVVDNAHCTSADGSATATVSGGVSPYTYVWSSGHTTSTATGLTAAAYTLTVSDAANCSFTVSVTVPSINDLVITATPADATAPGACDGSASVAATSSASSFSYLWNNFSDSSAISGLCMGNYSVTVTDNNGCTATASVFVSDGTGIAGAVSYSAGFRIFPNPSSGTTTIYFVLPANEKDASIGIYNLLGERIHSAKINNPQTPLTIDVSNFESGVYFCSLKTSAGVFTKKLTVMK